MPNNLIIRTVSGPGYGYQISHDRDRLSSGFYVSLSWAGERRDVLCAAFDDACHLGERFADIGRAWHVYVSRAAALNNGLAVMGA